MRNFLVPDLRHFYSQPYEPQMMDWRERGAVDKANNILKMMPFLDSAPESILEVGCGTGSVLQQLAAHQVRASLAGVDIGANRSQEIEEAASKANIAIRDYDGKRLPFEDGSFDFVYATHVLEHVPDERGFLHELRRVARRYVYVEVPCELHVRTSFAALQTTLMIGHINAYSPRSFALTLETSGLRVIRQEIYDHSLAVHRGYGRATWKAAVKMALRRSLLALNKDLASQCFTYHVGALCERSEPLTI